MHLLRNVVKVESHACQNMMGDVPISKSHQIVPCSCFRASHSKCSSLKTGSEMFYAGEKEWPSVSVMPAVSSSARYVSIVTNYME